MKVNAKAAEGKKISSLVEDKKWVLEREREALAKLASTPAGRSNKFYETRRATIKQLENDLNFLGKFLS